MSSVEFDESSLGRRGSTCNEGRRSLGGRRGRGGRTIREGRIDRRGRDRVTPGTQRGGVIILEDVQLVPPQDDLRAPLPNIEANQFLPAISEELAEEVEVVNTRRGQRTGRVRTRGGESTRRVCARGRQRVGRVRTRGGRGTVASRGRNGNRGAGRGMVLAHDTSFNFYRSIIPNVAHRPTEGIYDPLLFGERIEVPMHIKRPRLWPKSDVPLSLRSSTSTPEAPSSVPSPVQCVECPESGSTTSRSVQNKPPFSVCSQDIQMIQSPSTSIASAVPSPIQFIEYGGSRSSMSNLAQPENIPLNDYDFEYIVNFGSEGESDSEDEVFPSFVPRSERMFIETYDENDHEDEEISSHSPAPSCTTIFSNTYRIPAGPQRFVFDWKNFPETPIPPQERREVFVEVEGPVLESLGQARQSPEAWFTLIWDRAIMGQIVDETNRYAEEELLKALESLGPQSRLHRWIPTDIDELYVYFGVLLAMGNCIKSNVKEYWHCDGSICDTPNFSKYMSYNRFILLNKFLHFVKNDANTSALSHSEAKIYKIKPIVEHLNKKFQTLYKLKRNICIDESLTQWKGWLSINQFIKNKAASIGVKTYEVCDAKTGYLWRFEIHSGRKESTTEPPSPISGFIPSLVLRLLQGLENRGHCVWMDNYYNSPALARTLKTMGFDCVGTLRTNRQFIPPQLASLKKDNMVVGEIQGCTSGDVDILVWRDQNKVAMISTYHGNAVQNVNDTIKPIVVLDYNLCMGGVDRKDQQLAMFPIERKRTRVWYKKLFKRLLNVSVLNSFILHFESPVPEHPETRFRSHRGFRTDLINSLLKKKVQPLVSATTSRFGATTFSEEYFNHLPKQFHALPGRGGEKLRRVCVVCRKRTHTYCPGCNATLCVFDCFARYHCSKSP